MSIPKLTEHQRDLITMGLCPFCECPIRGHKVPAAYGFTDEACALLQAAGIDPADIDPKTAHARTCPHKQIRL